MVLWAWLWAHPHYKGVQHTPQLVVGTIVRPRRSNPDRTSTASVWVKPRRESLLLMKLRKNSFGRTGRVLDLGIKWRSDVHDGDTRLPRVR